MTYAHANFKVIGIIFNIFSRKCSEYNIILIDGVHIYYTMCPILEVN